jgi:hypothetical protein
MISRPVKLACALTFAGLEGDDGSDDGGDAGSDDESDDGVKAQARSSHAV